MMERVRQIIDLASGHQQPTREELASEFKITTRALANVISYMKAIGIEISSQTRIFLRRRCNFRSRVDCFYRVWA